jgi:hypothetical protein
MQIRKGIVYKAQKCVIYGPEGIGKSTFASNFPEPLFIDTEGSTNLLDVARTPKPSSWTMLLQMVNEVKNTPGICQTLVIDTIDWAEQLCLSHVCAMYDKTGIEDFGYGKGYVFVKEEFGRLLNLLSDVVDAGINIVLTAHCEIRKFEMPDECGSFDRYELKLGKKTGAQVAALVKEWADMILFANYKQIVVEVNKKRKAQGGSRVIYTQHHPCWDAKNRHEFKEELPFDYQEIAYAIPNDPVNLPPEENASKNMPKNMPEKMPEKIADHDMYMYHPESDAYWMLHKGETIVDNMDFSLSNEISQAEWEKGKSGQNQIKEGQAKPAQTDLDPKLQPKPAAPKAEPKAKPKTEPEPPQDDLTGIPPKLADLMRANHVTIGEIEGAVSGRGYYPMGTPIKNYDPSFIDGCLIAAWDQVFGMIKENRSVPF